MAQDAAVLQTFRIGDDHLSLTRIERFPNGLPLRFCLSSPEGNTGYALRLETADLIGHQRKKRVDDQNVVRDEENRNGKT